MMEPPVDPVSISPAFVPSFAAEIELVEVAEEAVLYDRSTGALHQLDPIATLVCAHFDGRRNLAQIVDELALVFAAERPTIESDVREMLRQLAHHGVLDAAAGVTRSEVDDARR